MASATTPNSASPARSHRSPRAAPTIITVASSGITRIARSTRPPIGETEKPQKVGNDFGVTGGGPVWIPHLYNGHNRTFFYGTYEGFRFPLGEAIQNIVPTQAMRSGDFSQRQIADHSAQQSQRRLVRLPTPERLADRTETSRALSTPQRRRSQRLQRRRQLHRQRRQQRPGIASWTHGTSCNIGAGSGAPNPIGRFGTAHVGDITGPGIVNLSTGFRSNSPSQSAFISRRAPASPTCSNHPNLADDSGHFNLNVASGDFGQISAARGSDFGGSRTGQVFLRLDF